MGKLTKAEQDRLWLLGRLSRFPGWSMCTLTGKSWCGHLATLVKRGWLEIDETGPLYRITEAGRAALTQDPTNE